MIVVAKFGGRMRRLYSGDWIKITLTKGILQTVRVSVKNGTAFVRVSYFLLALNVFSLGRGYCVLDVD